MIGDIDAKATLPVVSFKKLRLLSIIKIPLFVSTIISLLVSQAITAREEWQPVLYLRIYSTFFSQTTIMA
jgi:hypothetical protein